jgi:hypothetical protein
MYTKLNSTKKSKDKRDELLYYNTKQTKKFELALETDSEYTVLMYWEVLCKLCIDNTSYKEQRG